MVKCLFDFPQVPGRVRAASKWKEADQLSVRHPGFLRGGLGKPAAGTLLQQDKGFFCTLALLAWLFLSTMGQSSEIGSGLYGKHFASLHALILSSN